MCRLQKTARIGGKGRSAHRPTKGEVYLPDPNMTQLLQLIDSAYARRSWHGPNLRGSLRGIDPETAVFRPAPGRRNIWEIMLHAAYWKYVVWRRLTGEKRGSFPLKGSNWFVRPDPQHEHTWRSDLKLLDTIHRSLRAAVAHVDPTLLNRKPRGSKVTNLDLILGVAAHDVYHAGQIQLLKRLAAAPTKHAQ
jgi:uncharacterized damage-inducible protein DinB